MSTEAEHLCPPPFIVLSPLVLFRRMMIMISLGVKYKCKFTSIFPDKTHGKTALLYSVGRRRGAFLKENTLNHRQTNFIFCHRPGFVILLSICFCVVLCFWTHQHQQHPWARLCESLQKQPLSLFLTLAKKVLKKVFLKLYPI